MTKIQAHSVHPGPIVVKSSFPFGRLHVAGLNALKKAAPFRLSNPQAAVPLSQAQRDEDSLTKAQAIFFSYVTSILDQQGTKAQTNSAELAQRQYNTLCQIIARDMRGLGPLPYEKTMGVRLNDLLQTTIQGPSFFQGRHGEVRARVHEKMMESATFAKLHQNGQVADYSRRTLVQRLTNSRQPAIVDVLRGPERRSTHVVDEQELAQLQRGNLKACNVFYSNKAKTLCQIAYSTANERSVAFDRAAQGAPASGKPVKHLPLEKIAQQSFNATTSAGPFLPPNFL